VQNNEVSTAVNTAGFSETQVWTRTGSAGPVTAINVTNGGSGYLVPPIVTITGSGSNAAATASLTGGVVTSINVTNGGEGYTTTSTTVSITPAQNDPGTGAAATATVILGGCGGGAHTCYPPAVNYTPLYYLVNGQAFDKTNASNSLFAASPASGVTGNVLVRLVNAGLRMHVPSIVGSLTGAGTTSASGFSLIAEDGNPLPGVPRVQSEVFMAAGKTYDVMINVPAAGSTALPIYDRELSLSGNSVNRDSGMLAYISVNGASLPTTAAIAPATANGDSYVVSCQSATCNPLAVADVSKGVVANDVNVFGVSVATQPTKGTVALNANGTFTYTPTAASWSSDSFVYQANGNPSVTATVSLSSVAAEAAGGITCSTLTYTANTAKYFKVNTPGVLAGCKDAAGYKLTVDTTTVKAVSGSTMTVVPDANGGFSATAPSGSFTFQPRNSQGTLGPITTVNVTFPAGSGLQVMVVDGADKKTHITDYRWIIEEDRTFYIDPNNRTNTGGIVPTFGTNFHTSYMPVVATGCTGERSCESGQTLLGSPAVCDVGNGACRTDSAGTGETPVMPGDVPLDPAKRYYISVLPGDAAEPFIAGYGGAPDCSANGVAAGSCGHGMGGAPIGKNQTAVTVYTQPTPFPPAKLSVFVFEDDFPLNGEQDGGGGIDTLSPNEPGLGEFQITLFDDAGGTGDATGQPTYDMFNMPLSNSLAGTIDPSTGLDACPISKNATTAQGVKGTLGITGMIVTCPKYEADGITLSPLAGQAVVANMYPGRYGVVATPGADRIARGEEWLQTNTLDGQKAHDSFLRIGEPSFFQEYGPAGYHVSIGFANPKTIQSRLAGVCNGIDQNITGTNCTNTVTGLVTTERMSRTPDERLYSSGDNSSFAFTQCYVSFGDPDGEDFAFTKCNGDGSFSLSGLPDGDWRITVFDQWNDMLVDGLSTPVRLAGGNTVNMGDVAMNQWQANIYTSTFFDQNGDGVRQDKEPGLSLVATNIRFRDGSFSNFNNTDLSGNAGFNEIFPLFSWYVVETDSTRYKNTGTHVVYDSGGPADNSAACAVTGAAACGKSNIGNMMARTYEDLPLLGNLHFPGAVYCTTADCTGQSIQQGPNTQSTPNSTGRIDPPWVLSEGWQGFSGQNSFIEFGKTPFAAGENGGIRGHVVYASTRPFDDPQLLLQLSWEPLVPNVTINLYQESTAPDGSQKLNLVDTTKTSSFDDWAQGFRADGVPNMNCPGQGTASGTDADLFFFTLFNQPMWLDVYNHPGVTPHSLPNNSQFKCYDGMHNWNQVQPAPYDGMYNFPSIIARDPVSGAPTGTGATNGTAGSMAGSNCTICVANPTDGTPMLPAGKYVVEVVVPPGYELVKEEDKNILIGDNYIAPVTQEFGGLGNIFILPDQAEVGAAYNSYNPQNSTQDLGRTIFPSQEGDTGSVETFWPCVGEQRTVPDFISLFPKSGEVAPFAGAVRNLCDRKEVTLGDQMSALAKFYVFTSTHAAAHFTGVITDDYTSEFDPFSPQFGEKFSPPDLPISIKDWSGTEISRVYADQWGTYNGLTYSTWEVNPPNPTGYGPTMMITCMNDPGTGPTPDPLYNPQYSQFCYEIPFMPGQTQYMDTPVVPTSAFAGAGYNNPDCAYPALTPAIKEVDGDGLGPWVGGSPSSQGKVTDVALTNGGSGYITVPTVTFNNTGTGGTGASATAIIDASVASVTVNNHGRYPLNLVPNITFTGGGGSGADATAVMTGGLVLSVSITNGGSGYRNTIAGRPAVAFSAAPAGGVTATGTATVNNFTGRVTGVNITNPGSGYTAAPTVTFSAGSGTGARGTANLGQSVASVTVNNGGSAYVSAPTVTFSAPPGGTGGVRATGTAHISASVVGLNLTSGGSGYTSAPLVTISAPTAGGVTATATATVYTGTSTLTILALGDQMVPNNAYSGPSQTAAPYNDKKVLRHYGFGDTQGTGKVTIGGQTATINSWSDMRITVTVPNNVPPCTIQQQMIYGGPGNGADPALCGELVITAGTGQQSIDAVTVTIGGKPPVHIAPTDSIQTAIDAASPGDLLIVDPTCTAAGAAVTCISTAVDAPTPTQISAQSAHEEMLLMWKPVRLQGVGAPSSIINANTHPGGKLDNWRRRVNCLFGLAINGTPITGVNPYDDPNDTANNGGPFACTSDMQFSVDRLPLEATVGWDATLNGNLAELLQEPTLMGALEGAGITVLSKGVKFPAGSLPFGSDTFPTGTTLLTANDCGTSANRYPSNFWCNPSSIDALGITDSSQGGGGIFVHAWGHNIQIANNRINSNAGTLSGGINVGQGEFPPAYLQGAVNADPGSCQNVSFAGNRATNAQLPYCHNLNVNVHNNSITSNSSTGDELFSATPAGAGGVSFCTGSDFYKFQYNWVCGNLSSGDGGGIGHLGFSYNGDIEHNTILFNQSTNPTIPSNGGGIVVMGAPDVDPLCGATTDADCQPTPSSVGPSDGTGPNLVINANLIMGNAADSGSGGGLRLQAVNGSDAVAFPSNCRSGGASGPNCWWNSVSVTNNIIANNVAGWDGAGISLVDALNANIINNTIISNDTTASSGVLFNTIGAPLASSEGPCPANYQGNMAQGPCVITSTPQPAGLVSIQNSAILQANLPNSLVCPANHYAGNNSTGSNATCRRISYPEIYNDVFWQNRAFFIGVGSLGGGTQNQQNVVKLYDASFSTPPVVTPAESQSGTGQCVAPAQANYWDIGVRGDTGPTNHVSANFTLNPMYSVLTNTSGYSGTNFGTNPTVVHQYCNGSRVPPELGTAGYQVPPGISDATVPNPIFSLTPAATVDEGNNWINLSWGPLALNKPDGSTLGNYTLATGSPAIDAIGSTASTYADAPATDFFGNPRKTAANPCVDVGAVDVSAGTQCGGVSTQPGANLTPSSHSFGTVTRGTNPLFAPVFGFTLTNTGTATLTNIVSPTITANSANFSIVALLTSCGTINPLPIGRRTSLNPGQSCTITVRFDPPVSDAANSAQNGTVSITDAVGTQTSSLSGTAR
jgi:hypothetical protein